MTERQELQKELLSIPDTMLVLKVRSYAIKAIIKNLPEKNTNRKKK